MKSLVPSAADINAAHKLARTTAETAVQHAFRCGQLLTEKKASLPRGEFQKWVEANCEFAYSTAANYMKLSHNRENSNALEPSHIRHLFPSGTKPAKPKSAAPAPKEKPAPAQVSAPAAISKADPDEPDAPSDDDLAEEIERTEREYSASISKVMHADDKLAAAHAEIKRQAAEISSLKIARDGFMNGKNAMTKLLKKEQSITANLRRQLDKAKDEIDRLKERIAIMEESA